MKYAGIFYGHLVYFTAIWYILGLFGVYWVYLVYYGSIWYLYFMFFGIFFPVLVYCTQKTLATPIFDCHRTKEIVIKNINPALLPKLKLTFQKSFGGSYIFLKYKHTQLISGVHIFLKNINTRNATL
jgi:hypothetical protein